MYKILDLHSNNTIAALPDATHFNRTVTQGLKYISGTSLAQAIEAYTLQGHLEVNKVMRASVDSYVQRLQSIMDLFPATVRTEADRILARDEFDEPLQQYVDRQHAEETEHSRQVRFVWDLISGVTGTFMGLYNRHKLNALRESLATTNRKTDDLIRVSKAQAVLIHQLRNSITEIARSTLLMAANPAAVTNAKLQQMLDTANRSIDKAIRAIQAAQHRRLSADFLDPEQLHAVFEKLSSYAQAHQKKLLIDHPSDLLQVELSYFFSGSDINMLLHVPMAPANAILRLMRHRPFPIPLDDSTGLMPDLDRDVLAISDASALAGQRLTMEVKFTDLMECHQINSVYLCEKHGVLQYQSNTSCLAALYGQDHDAALKLCEMNIVDLDEAVLPLGNNRFLIYNDQSGYNAELQCLNVAVQDITLTKGMNTVTLPEHCSLRLRTSMIFADSSVHLKTDFHVYEWDWTRSDRRLTSFRDTAFLQDLHNLAVDKTGNLNLIDVLQTAEARNHTNNLWLCFYISAGFVSILAATLGAIYIFFFRNASATASALSYLYAAVATRFASFSDALPAPIKRRLQQGYDLALPFTQTSASATGPVQEQHL